MRGIKLHIGNSLPRKNPIKLEIKFIESKDIANHQAPLFLFKSKKPGRKYINAIIITKGAAANITTRTGVSEGGKPINFIKANEIKPNSNNNIPLPPITTINQAAIFVLIGRLAFSINLIIYSKSLKVESI